MPKLSATKKKLVFTLLDGERMEPLHDALRRSELGTCVMGSNFDKGYFTLPRMIETARILRDVFKNNDAYQWKPDNKYREAIEEIRSSNQSWEKKLSVSEKIKEIDKPDQYMKDYQFKVTPRAHQKIGFLLIKKMGSIFLSWEMRTGKTPTTLWAMEHLLETGRIKRPLVMCPKSLMQLVWVAEAQKMTDLKGCAPCQNSVPDRLAQLKRDNNYHIVREDGSVTCTWGKPDFIVLNHGVLRESLDPAKRPVMNPMMKFIMNEYQPDFLVLDESHRYKDQSSKRTAAMLKVAAAVHARKGIVICLSGTPATRSPVDLYSQMNMVDPTIFPFNQAEFIRRYCTTSNGGKFVAQDIHNFEELVSRYKPRCHRVLMSHCYDMPERNMSNEPVTMTPKQKRHHDELYNDLMTYIKGESVYVHVLTKFAKMCQVTGGYMFDNEGELHYLEENPKIEALKNMLEQIICCDSPNKAIIWTYYKPPLLKIRECLKSLDIDFAEISGETKKNEERSMASRRFQNDKNCRVMLASPNVAGEGFNMSAANYAIFFDQSYRYDFYKQARARNFTDDSKKHGTIHEIHITAEKSVDQLVVENLQRKGKMDIKITDEMIRGFSKRL